MTAFSIQIGMHAPIVVNSIMGMVYLSYLLHHRFLGIVIRLLVFLAVAISIGADIQLHFTVHLSFKI